MQKVQSYLYPNRVILIADLAGFNVENTIVYAKTVKIYKGIDNVIQFDIQNPDQKRLDLVTTPLITSIQMNVMDAGGNALPNSPYTVTPIGITLPGIASVTIPSTDLTSFQDQYLKYSVTAIDNNSNNIPLYTDSRFSAVGTMEIVESAMPTTKNSIVYDRFSGEINFMGNVTNHTSAIPCKFYESYPTTQLNFSITTNKFIGTIFVEGTEDSTISVESFRNAPQLQVFTTTVATNSPVTFTGVLVGKYNYLRVGWTYPDIWQYGSQQDPQGVYGMVNTVTVSY
jgi:hypothetical protein